MSDDRPGNRNMDRSTRRRNCVLHTVRNTRAGAERTAGRAKKRGTTAKPFKLGKLDPEKYHAKKEALSLMIQVMTRSITNNISKEDAAKVLFRRQGRDGTGSRWLPDCLDGLPALRGARLEVNIDCRPYVVQ